MPFQIEPWNIINELNSLIDNSVQRSLRRDDSQVETSHWRPSVDIKEEADHYLISADVPGVDPNQINISMENNNLIIKGSREETKQEERNSYYRIERIKGNFYRRFTLPDNGDSENIKARSKNGVLEITIPKKQKALSKKITVEENQ